jgi:O-antigen chain-terminating methyltransferase
LIFHLPVIVRNLEQFENQTLRQRHEQARWTNALASRIEDAFNQTQQSLGEHDVQVGRCIRDLGQCISDLDSLKTMVEGLSGALAAKAGNEDLKALAAEMAAIRSNAASRLDVAALQLKVLHELSLKAEKADVEIRATQAKADAATIQRVTREIQREILNHKHYILDQQRRHTLLLEEARQRSPEPIRAAQAEAMLAEADHLLDAFYVSFEDRFRGPREDIKQRVAIYLPIVKDVGAGTQNAAILDIGCGRGEWLELLKENELVARGVDLNRILVSQCRELGLEVFEADAIDYLRKLEANSCGAVTGMHIIEHVPFKRLIALFDEVLRVLKPGGVAIFETPNPENLVVGACKFYYDPTHLNPLPPEPMRYAMEERGFGRVEILRLHPDQDSVMLKEDATPLEKIVNGLMFGARDYCLVAYKS